MADTEITGLVEETAPVSADLVVIVDDVAGTPATEKATIGSLTKGLSPNALTAKATPVAADEIILGDTEASNVAKKATLTALDTTLRGITGVESGATADQTGAEIKSAYEGEADTNAFDDAAVTKLAGIETAADVTDATNVDAAGAVMEADFNAQTVLAATSDNTPAALTVSEQTVVGRITGGNVAALSAAEVRGITNTAVDINAETASFTFALADAGKTTTISNAGATTATVPPNSSVAFPTNTILILEQIGAGASTWTPGAAVTLNQNANKSLVTNGQYAITFARKTATDTWTVYGDLVPLNPLLDATYAISDETTALTTGTAKLSWYSPPYATTLVSIAGSVVTAPTGASLIMDVNAAGATIMTTNKLTIEAAEFHTKDATTQPTLTTTAIAANTLMTADIDQIGSTVAGAGAKIILTYRRT